MSGNAKRQAAYSERQREAGRRQRSMWLTDAEFLALSELLKKLRKTETDAL